SFALHLGALSEPVSRLATQIQASYDDSELWEELDNQARDADAPDEAELVYEAILARPGLPTDSVRSIGQRYVEFLEEWYEETAKPIAVLHQLVRRDAGNGWALEKLSLLLTLA